MAEVAHGVSSPCCGTFSTAAGAIKDEQLYGSCGRCGKSFAIPNPSYAPNAASKVLGAPSTLEFHVKQNGAAGGNIIVTGYGLEYKLSDFSLDAEKGDVLEVSLGLGEPAPNEKPVLTPPPVNSLPNNPDAPVVSETPDVSVQDNTVDGWR